MPPKAVRSALVLVLFGALATGCGSAPPQSPPTGVDELEIPTPSPQPGEFVARIDNPLLPLTPGSRWVYRYSGSDGSGRIVTTVLDTSKVVAGVRTTVVHDVARDSSGTVVEDTYDWYAQDSAGNVWYFGEQTTSYDGRLSSSEGSWEAGVDGAEAGVVMLAAPRIGDSYQQESLPGVAEDRATILALDATVSVPYGVFRDVLQTKETTPLEPDLVEEKFYARGVGSIREVETAGGDEVTVLVAFTAG